MKNILILGYFNENNLGDDVFLYIWKIVSRSIPNSTFYYSNISELGNSNFNGNGDAIDVIILAGGNLLLEYFEEKIIKFIDLVQFKGTILAFSMATPFKGYCIKSKLLDKINYINCRSKFDSHILNLCYGKKIVDFLPDISMHLPILVEPFNHKILCLPTDNKKFNIGVFLTRPIYKSPVYSQIIKNIAAALDEITSKNTFHLYLIPFDTNKNKPGNCDFLINNDVYQHVQNKNNCFNVTQTFNVQEMFYIFQNQLDMSITMRFHSVMYSIVTDTPFIPIFTTNKVKELVDDIEYNEYSYKLNTDNKSLPLEFDTQTFLIKFFNVWNNKLKCTSLIQTYKARYNQNFDQFISVVKNKIDCTKNIPPITRNVSIHNIIGMVTKYLNENGIPTSTKQIQLLTCKKISLHSLLVEKTLSPHETHQFSFDIASIICWAITKNPTPIYHYGIYEKILSPSFVFVNDVEWIWNDFIKQYKVKYSPPPTDPGYPLFNMKLTAESGNGNVHRSGWNFVLDNLHSFHDDNSNLIFDNYIDKTFHWNSILYKYSSIIPYKSKWCGIIHHTFDTTFSSYNSTVLFNDPLFKASLEKCCVLFTLSKHLATQVQQALGIESHVKVHSLVHPTEVPDVCFDLNLFVDNPHKKIIHIGGWLRNNYTIYKLQPTSKHVHKNDHVLQLEKCKLQGKDMEPYFKPRDLKITFQSGDQQTDGTRILEYTFSPQSILPTTNKYIHGLINCIQDYHSSVTVLDTLENEDYDTLLSQNIVFLDLVDASAVNTIVECITRCTPLLVNPLPAVVELLGKDYPFYYNDLSEANYKASFLPCIKDTFEYLSKLDKSKFTIEYFINDITNVLKIM